MARLIYNHEGKCRGKKGVTIHILVQNTKEKSKTITAHDMTVDELYEHISFFLKAITNAKNYDIIIKGDEIK